MNKDINSKAKIVTSAIMGKVEFILGICGTILFGLSTIMGITDIKDGPSVAAVIILVLITLLCVKLILMGRKTSKLVKAFKDYVSRLSNDPTGSIDNLAAGVGTSVDVVKDNLQGMIDKKYFVNANIDTDTNCIVFPKATPKKEKVSNEEDESVEHITVSCSGCGAANEVIKGTVCECEYCGTKIE